MIHEEFHGGLRMMIVIKGGQYIATLLFENLCYLVRPSFYLERFPTI